MTLRRVFITIAVLIVAWDCWHNRREVAELIRQIVNSEPPPVKGIGM